MRAVRGVAAGGVLVVALAAIYGLHWVQSPGDADIESANQQAVSNVLGSETALTTWQTDYFTTEIPAYLKSKTTTLTPTGAIVASYLLTSSNARQDDQLAVTIGHLGNNQLSELPAVKLRALQTGDYQPATKSYAPPGALVFRKLDGYETALYWQHGSDYVGVVASGSVDRRPDLEQALSSVVGEWQWR